MSETNYKVFDNFTGQFTVMFKNNPFNYRVYKLNKTLYRIKIFLTDNFNYIGYAMIRNDSSRHNGVVSIKLQRQVPCASLTDLKLDKVMSGISQVAELDLDKILHKSSKAGAMHALKNRLRSDKNILYTTKQGIKDIKAKMNHIQNNN